ncbi:hypothetical protein BC829DRAFT_436701 [Chytridium lagenaria]|nr:hypothetical protein BC829DRAFT_436701 [Chytridium lagenaria]
MEECQRRTVAPAKWVGAYVKKDVLTDNSPKEERSLKQDKDEEKDQVQSKVLEKDDEETKNGDTPSSNKTLVGAVTSLNDCQVNLLVKQLHPTMRPATPTCITGGVHLLTSTVESQQAMWI